MALWSTSRRPGQRHACGVDLRLEEVKVLQWVPGAGDDLHRDWTWLFEKINALGQGLWLSAGSPEAAVALWEKYNQSRRMILHVHAPDRDAMARYLEAFEGIGRTRSAPLAPRAG